MYLDSFVIFAVCLSVQISERIYNAGVPVEIRFYTRTSEERCARS